MNKWIAVLATALLAGAIQAAEISGRVVGVADGDTVTVLDSTKA
jgi:endonuclease YncB( thermonuclease family)